MGAGAGEDEAAEGYPGQAHQSLPLRSLKEPGARLEALQEVCSRLPHENLSNLR